MSDHQAEAEAVSTQQFNLGIPSHNYDSDNEAAIKERDRKVSDAITELITTERNYVSMMNNAIQLYIEPLKHRQHIDILSQLQSLHDLYQDIITIFHYYEQIARLHVTILNDIDSHINTNTILVAKTFIQYAPQLLFYYRSYSVHYVKSSMNQLMTRLQRENPSFYMYCQQMTLDTRSNGLTMESYIILPMGRLPRYILLLKYIMEYTMKSSPEYVSLNEAIDTLGSIVNIINDALKVMEEESSIQHKSNSNTSTSICSCFN